MQPPAQEISTCPTCGGALEETSGGGLCCMVCFEQLETLAKIPAGVSYGDIRLDPFWDPLRGDSRFQKLCEEKQH